MDPITLHRSCGRVGVVSTLLLLLVVFIAYFVSDLDEGPAHLHGEGSPVSILEASVQTTANSKWQEGPDALQPELIRTFQTSAYDVLDQIGIPRNLSDSDLGEACDPLLWPCVAVTGKCVLEQITQVIDGHLAPAPSACICFLSSMAPTDMVPGRDMALSCPFVCMQALLNAFNTYLRERNGPGGQTLECLKASGLSASVPPRACSLASPRGIRGALSPKADAARVS
jgi:hypothetical protein